MLSDYGDSLVVVIDDDSEYFLNTRYVMKNGKAMYFGSVRIDKNYVSYHLMPVYVAPSLLEGISPALKKRMQRKSCFNFKVPNKGLFEELAVLTAAGYRYYYKAGYIGAPVVQ